VTPAGVACTEVQDDVLTYGLIPAGPIPTAFDPDGVYPYLSFVETSDRPVLKKYGFVVLENAKLRVTICPDRGGRVTSIVHKGSGKEVLYAPDVIRPTRILPRFGFVAGGIEVSFPISHSPVQNDPVLYRIDRTNARSYVTCGERELRFGMQWSVEYSLGPDDDFVTQRAVFHNPGRSTHPWMSWSNAAVPSAPDTQYHFPRGRVLAHSSTLAVIDWRPMQEADIAEMTGFFWQTKDANAFGAFTPSFGAGLYHIAHERVAPGMKLWSYGAGKDSAWATLSSNQDQPYAEIQGGPISDQSTKLELEPQETHSHVEFWIPSDKPLDIYALKIPNVQLRPIKDVPLFEWAREGEVKVWRDLVRAYASQGRLPQPPALDQCLWPPSGMEDLNAAFKWGIEKTDGEARERWKFYHGTWLAGRGEKSEAIAVLSATRSVGVAKALLARLLAMDGDIEGAAKAHRSVQEQWLQRHPQIIVARDQALRALGTKTLAERAQWLGVDAVPDERIIERRVQLLIDKGEVQAAKRLLLSTPFQKVHQRYVRTALWKQLCEKLNEPGLPIPAELGEDQLAAFGAYREFE
jgi:hypothetical protein